MRAAAPEHNTPSLALTLSEPLRAARETFGLAAGLPSLVARHRAITNHPVLVMPGYGGADGSTAALRHFLRRIGYNTYALELGRNVEQPDERIRSVDDATSFRQKMSGLTLARVQEIADETGSSVSLVGWSMGGLYALDASNAAPQLVERVITLGTPFGDPRGTSLFNIMRKLSRSTVPIESQNFDAWLALARATVPTHVLYSERDGIVHPDIAGVQASAEVTYQQVDSSHIAFTHNPRVFDAVARLLGEPAGDL